MRWNNTVLEDCVIIDLQIINYGFPGTDLAYFLYSSSHPSIRKKNLENWLQLYHGVLKNELTAFGYPDLEYTLEEVKKDYQHASYFGFIMGLMHTQVNLLCSDTSIFIYYLLTTLSFKESINST